MAFQKTILRVTKSAGLNIYLFPSVRQRNRGHLEDERHRAQAEVLCWDVRRPSRKVRLKENMHSRWIFFKNIFTHSNCEYSILSLSIEFIHIMKIYCTIKKFKKKWKHKKWIWTWNKICTVFMFWMRILRKLKENYIHFADLSEDKNNCKCFFNIK